MLPPNCETGAAFVLHWALAHLPSQLSRLQLAMNLHLVRHGQTNFNAEHRVQGQYDSVLDETGRHQAAALRPTVEAIGPTAVYSSSNLRARQTTEILTTNISLEASYRDNLREIFMGPWQQRLWEEVQKSESEQFSRFMTQPHLFQLDGAETFQELQNRGVEAMEQIIAEEETGDVLVVSHGAILKTILAHYANVELARMWEEPHLGNCDHSVLRVGPNDNVEVVHVAGVPLSQTSWFRY